MMKILAVVPLLLSFSANAFCVAHRGYSAKALENSREAIMLAAEAGVGGIEFDIRRTRDGVAIVNHDANLERVVAKAQKSCARKEDITKLNLANIRDNCKLKNGESVSTLEEILRDLLPYSSRLFIEFKDSPSKSDMELIERYYSDQAERVYFISFSKEYLDLINSWKKDFAYLEKTKIFLLRKRVDLDLLNGIDGFDSKYMSQATVDNVQAHGMEIGAYTKDSRRKIKRYFDRGVDFVTTNRPTLCMQVLSDMGRR
jgi:glycerophosphoryl diester phosphodiesterase